MAQPAHKKLRPTTDATASYLPHNILVTGGAGFIASHIVLQLAKKFPQYKVMLPRPMRTGSTW